jgi:hypothetical protein
VNGFRYNARVLAEHLARRLTGWKPPHERVDDIVAFLLHELSTAPDLWVQKGYLCRAVSRSDGVWRDEGVMPLAIYLDAVEDDGAAASVDPPHPLPPRPWRDPRAPARPAPAARVRERALPQARRCARRLTWRKTGSPRESAPP